MNYLRNQQPDNPYQWLRHAAYQHVNDLVNGRRGITPNTALRLAKYFDNTPAFWMNLQLRWDLYFADQAEKKVLQGISPYQPHPATEKQIILPKNQTTAFSL